MERMKIFWRSMVALSALSVVGLVGYRFSAQRAQAEPAEPNKPKEAAYQPRKKGTLTFSRDIAPIIFENCTSCHRAGEVGPFPLQTYQDVKKRARQIAYVTHNRSMPPWKAEVGFNSFVGERRLTNDQLGMIQQWVEEGASEGKRADLPALPKFTEGWSLGTPDAVFQPDQSFTLAGEGKDEYRNFVIPTNYAEDRWISTVEVRPGNSKVVHHVLIFLDTTGTARKLDAKDAAPGYSTFGGIGFLPSGGLGGWAPGNLPRPLPPGTGVLLPKGADIVLQVHYHRSGKSESDRTKIGVHFAKGPVDKQVRVLPVVYPFLRIPAGESNYTVRAGMGVPGDVTLINVTPHMHLLGRSMTVTAQLPDGTTRPVVKVPDWDFNWQTTYVFKEPMKLPQGARIQLAATYDNSEKNPRNPSSPPKTVTWGEETTDEMCIAFVSYTVDSEHLTKGIKASGYLDFGGGNRRGNRGEMLREVLQQFRSNRRPNPAPAEKP
jgi:hypothetical protein